ncbi:S-methyl-5'-thioadenosine phosphorylase [Phycisphaerae bacterium RAS1]|nr:S-methyl-5'-thioadenosine phosphorylase [Phycisphaerae bacterium RAS1]
MPGNGNLGGSAYPGGPEGTLACIGGTSAYDLLQEGAFVAERLGPQKTPFGLSQPIFRCESRFGGFLFLSRHGETGYDLAPSFVNYRANIYALKNLGVRAIVSWSESRATSHNYKIGQYVVVDDLIDETHARANTFFEGQGIGRVRQWPVFCPSLRKAFSTTFSEQRRCFAERGTYVCIEGPRRETPAEARKYEIVGGEMIGYTLAPEVFLAKELQMCYAAICYIAGYAENGSDFRPFEAGRVLEEDVERQRARKAVERLPLLLEHLMDVLNRTPGICDCERSMAQYLASGQIGPDWRGWFEDMQGRPRSAPVAAPT